MKTVYREKRYYCGEYLDVYIYPTYRQGRSRGKRSKPTSAAQAKLNQRHREEKLVRLLHANFTPDDLEIHLTYQQQPESPEEAQRLLRNYIRRVQRARKKQGLPPLKYIAVTEKGSKNGRYHHHVTLSGGMDRDELEKLWGLGYANSRRLQFTESGLAGLGHYIVKSPLYARAWNASKNLIDPEPKTRDGRISGKRAEELARDTTNNAEYERLYPGYFLADAGAWHNDVNGGKYTQSSEVTDSDGDVAPRGGLCYYKVIIRGGVRYFKGVFHPLVKAILGNDSAATKGSSITFGTSATTFTVFRCNSGAWRITKEFTTESECIAWCDTKLGKVGG